MPLPQASPSSDSAPSTTTISAPAPRLQRIRRPEPPNKAAHLTAVNVLDTEIESLQQRIQVIKSTLDRRNQGIVSPELAAAKKTLADLNTSFKQVVDRKRAHREELELLKEKLRGSGFRSGLQVSIPELDEQIRNLEHKQTHTSLPINEEKRLISQIEKLKKSRDSLSRHESRTAQDQGLRTQLIESMQKDDDELNALRAKQEHYRHILSDIYEKESANATDKVALAKERDEAYQKIKSLRAQINNLKAEFNVKEDDYWKMDNLWRAQQAQEDKMKRERSRAEWLEREKIRKQRALENFVEPYTDEIILCEQLLCYMQKSVPQDEGTSMPQQQQTPEITAPEGFGVALVSKKNRNDDELHGWFAGSASKKGKKSKGITAPKSKAREKISLSLDALSSFGKLKISPPATYGDCTKSVVELKQKKEQFLEMQKKARELRERGTVNGGSHVGNGVSGAVSEISTEESSVAECSNSAGEDGPLDDLTTQIGPLDDHTAMREANGGSHIGNGAEGAVLEILAEEGSIAECSTSVDENCPLNDHTTEKGPMNDHSATPKVGNTSSIVTDAGDGIPPIEYVDVGSSLEQDKQEDLASSDDKQDDPASSDKQEDLASSDKEEHLASSKDNAQLDDRAHLETFEFSEARLGTEEEDAHIEEQAADNIVVSVIFDCATQNGALKELTSEGVRVEEPVVEIIEEPVVEIIEKPVVEVIENGVNSNSLECEGAEILASANETLETNNGSESLVMKEENVRREDSNGVLEVKDDGTGSANVPYEMSPVVKEQVVAHSAEEKVLQNGGCEEISPLLGCV